MKASSASASAKICASERFSPLTRPSICRGETCWRSVRGTKSAAGVSSSTTPVKWRDTCVQLQPAQAVRRVVDRRDAPAHAHQHHEVVHVPVQDAGELRAAPGPRSRRAVPARAGSGSRPCAPGRAGSAPFSDSEKRWRSVGRSERWPCAAATMARQASPHSAPSVCRITGTRLEPKPRRKPPQAPRRGIIPAPRSGAPTELQSRRSN